MARPAVGAAPNRCDECGGYEYGGAPVCPACRALVDGIVEDEWSVFLARMGAVGERDAAALAEMVAAEPDRHDWRVVDAALDRLTCPDCGDRLARGPLGCAACDLAHGFRYAAVETDRPGVPWGNEHGVRVNVSVVRRPHVTSADELLARRLTLPLLLAGHLPTTAEAQRMSARIRQAPAARRAEVIAEAVEEVLRRTAGRG
ncbi:hypothetical protein ACFVSN_01495 [Kitasatospora sp. NPDC057904]|uniref:hypothetical protein n=1 Tax=unclassified Kitasatospora TaxID=2633591 RepID=UPI0036DDB87E